jgi:hypothetical protein
MPRLVELGLLLAHLRVDLSDVCVENLLLLLQQHLGFHLLLVIGCLTEVFSFFVRLTWLTGSVHSLLLLLHLLLVLLDHELVVFLLQLRRLQEVL